MLIPDVAVTSQVLVPDWAMWVHHRQGRGRLTVEICGGVDAKSLYRASQVPHFLQGRALAEGDRNAYECEDDLECDRGVAHHTETFSDGCETGCQLLKNSEARFFGGLENRGGVDRDVPKRRYKSTIDALMAPTIM